MENKNKISKSQAGGYSGFSVTRINKKDLGGLKFSILGVL